MAKVIYAPTIAGYVGRVGTGVHYRAKSTRFGYLRAYVMPSITENMTAKGAGVANVAKLYRTAKKEVPFFTQLKAYTAKYADLPSYGDDLRARANSAFAVFYKALWAVHMDNPGIDLATVTKEDLVGAAEEIFTIKTTVEKGWLPMVEGYEEMTGSWKIPSL